MIRILLFGAGRMARSLLSLAGEFPEVTFVAQVSRNDPDTAAENDSVPFFTSLKAALESGGNKPDLLIDFSLASGTPVAARWCAENGVPMLSGVTGIGDDVQATLDAVAKTAPVLWAPNLSFGVNLLAGLLRELSSVTSRASAIRIEETHHTGKKDAPSGTALYLAQQLRSATHDREETDPQQITASLPDIEFVSRREGDVVGDHDVLIELRDESLTLSHHARDRRLFARGALEAGMWLLDQPAARYSAEDWIRSIIRSR